jgi:methionyl-tRNA formyltransferase
VDVDTAAAGCLNIQPSLLHAVAARAPIHRAIESGDTQTGIDHHADGRGAGHRDMLVAEKLAIRENDTTASLHDRLAVLGGRLIVEALEIAALRRSDPARSSRKKASPDAHEIEKNEAAIDWFAAGAGDRRAAARLRSLPGASAQLAARA